jgi:hypothetical protein
MHIIPRRFRIIPNWNYREIPRQTRLEEADAAPIAAHALAALPAGREQHDATAKCRCHAKGREKRADTKNAEPACWLRTVHLDFVVTPPLFSQSLPVPLPVPLPVAWAWPSSPLSLFPWS